MELKNFVAQDDEGNVQPWANCFLYMPGTTELVEGLQDVRGEPLANPFTANKDGLVQFAAPDGRYDLRITLGAKDQTIRIQCNDAIGSVSREDLSNPDRGAAMVARGVVAVDSIADLLSLPAGQRREDLRYETRGYHEPQNYLVNPYIGGGSFRFNPARSKQDHDGSTVISVTVPAIQLQSGTTLSERLLNFVNAVGETDPGGFGAFEREISDRYNLMSFGGLGGAMESLDGPFTAFAKFVNRNEVHSPEIQLPLTGTISIETTFAKPVKLTGPCVIEAPQVMTRAFHFKDRARLIGVEVDHKGFYCTEGNSVLLESPFEFIGGGIRNMSAPPAQFSQYPVQITPFNGEYLIEGASFSRVFNQTTGGGSNPWCGFIYVFGDAANVTETLTHNIRNNKFDHCRTLPPAGTLPAELGNFRDSDAIRVFYNDPPEDMPDRSVMNCEGNTFRRIHKRFYKTNSTTLNLKNERSFYFPGDLEYETVESGMTQVAQLAGGARVLASHCNFIMATGFYPFITYGMNRDCVLEDCTLTNRLPLALATGSRLMFDVEDETSNLDAEWRVRRLKMEGFGSLFRATAGARFYDFKDIELLDAFSISRYDHTNSKGYSIEGLSATIRMEGGTGTTGVSIYEDPRTGDSERGVALKDITITDIVRTAASGQFPPVVQVDSNSPVLDNVTHNMAPGANPSLSNIVIRSSDSPRLLRCSAYGLSLRDVTNGYLAGCLSTNVTPTGSTQPSDFVNTGHITPYWPV